MPIFFYLVLFFFLSHSHSVPLLPTFSLCPTENTNIKLQYHTAAVAKRLRSLSELMSHMCGGSGPHQKFMAARRPFPLGGGGLERAQRAGK